MQTLSVSAVVKLVGINENTLRTWERRYQAVAPGRDDLGQRSYQPKDVERIRLLWALVKEGYSIGKIAKLSDRDLRKELSSTLSPETSSISLSSSKHEAFRKEILSALERFDLEALNLTLKKARFEISTKDMVLNLIWPLLKQVGHLVTLGKLSITQEHILSSLLRDHLGMIHQALAPYEDHYKKRKNPVIITTREGDIHEFGILLASILANVYHHRTVYLGPNMPVGDLVEAARLLKPEFIILGVMALPPAQELVSIEEFVGELDRALPRKVSFYVGGSGAGQVAMMKTERKVVELSDLTELDRILANAR